MNPEELLAHSDFVQSLARSLVVDEHRASDVVQDTWLAALQHPPAGDKPVRAWLATVVRNFSRIMYRSESSRSRREHASPGPEDPPSPEEIATREESRRRMIEAVLGLEGLYRDVILRRYYQDQSPREIARHLELPLETVRTRLKRGIEKLKVKLDESHGGSRKAWCLALAPLAVLHSEKAVAGMGAVKVGLAAALLVALPLVIWRFLPEEPSSAVASPVEPASVVQLSEEPPVRNVREAMLPAGKEDAPAGLVTWTGVVFNYNGKPVERTKIRLGTDGMETQSKKDGSFTMEEIDPATYMVYLDLDLGRQQNRSSTDPGFFAWGEVTFDESGEVQHDIQLPGAANLLCGSVINDGTGAPYLWEGGYGQFGERGGYCVMAQKADDFDTVFEATVDPADASFFFMGIPTGKYDLLLFGPSLYWEHKLKANVPAGPLVGSVDFRIPQLGELHLLLKNLTGPKVKLCISPGLPAMTTGMPLGCEDHAFLLAPGKKQITIKHPERGEMSRSIEIRSGENLEMTVLPEDFAGAGEPRTIEGFLTRADGTPMTPAALDFMEGGYQVKKKVDCFTDSEGRFVWKDCVPGLYGLDCLMLNDALAEKVRKQGWVDYHYDDPMYQLTLRGIEIPNDPPDGFTLQVVLPKGSMSGVLVDRLTGGPPREGLPCWRVYVASLSEVGSAAMCICRNQDRFVMDGLPAGRYRLAVLAPGYDMMRSEMLELSDGQAMDLGRIELNPTGCVILDVRDPSGKKVDDWELWCGGKNAGESMETRKQLPPSGKEIIWGLPTGGVTLEVKAPSFQPSVIDLRLDPAQPQELKVVLTPPT